MKHNYYIALVTLVMSAGLMSCGGGGGAGGSSAPSTAQPDDATDVQMSAVLPAIEDQPNTISQHVVTDGSGRVHATYADVEDRIFYSTCLSDCSSASAWSSIVLRQFSTGIAGSATPKIGLDSSGQIHIAIVTDTNDLFTSDVFYASCDSLCTQQQSWTIGLAFSLNETIAKQNLQFHDWFAVSPTGEPHIALFGSSEFLVSGEDHLHLYSCRSLCSSEASWTRQQVAMLDFASPSGAHLKFDNQGIAHISGVYTVIGADTGTIIYATCLAFCNSSTPEWSASAELGEITDDPLDPHGSAFDLLDGQTPIIATFAPQDQELQLLSCVSNCSLANSWASREVQGELPLPAGLTLPEEHIVLNAGSGRIEIGMIGKDVDFGIAHRVIRLSCDGLCESPSWTFASLADTSPVVFENIGNCLFFGTGIIGPINLTPGAVSYGAYPHWGCSGTPVLVTVPGFGNFIDTNDDLRFFEIAVYETTWIN